MRVVAAAGQAGAAGPRRSSGNSAAVAAGSWSVAHTTRGVAWTKTRRSTEPCSTPGGRRRAGIRPRDRDGRPSSDADRVPDRLHLEEGGDPFGALGGPVVEPVEAGLGDRRRAPREALDVVGGEQLGLECASSSGTPQVSSASTSTCAARTGTSSALQAGQDVDDAAGHVRGGEDLGQRDRRQRPRLGRRRARRRCRSTSGGARRLDEAEQRRRLGRDDADDAGRLGDREVEVRRRDRVGRARGPGRSCRPSRRTRPSGRWPGPRPRGRAASRRPSAAATSADELVAPALHQLGDAIEDLAAVHRGLGRPSRGRPCAPPGRRRAGPCARRGRRWRAACRRRR